jgi:Uma2 family endonuclease
MDTTLTRRRFTVRKYERMIEAGLRGEDDRVALIDGDILTMTPISPQHAARVKRLNALLMASPLTERFIVSVHDPISLPSTESRLQPDGTLLVPPLSRYDERHPGVRDVPLVIEVADTSGPDDRAKQTPIYARAGISEVWLIDLPSQTVERYRSPSPAGYTDVARFGRPQTITPAAPAGLTIVVDQMLG